jgi:hypothetical protein
MPKPNKTHFVGPSILGEKHSRMYLFDGGTGEIVAELSEDAAAAVRKARVGPVRLTYNGSGENVQVEA